jgi:hypothetical protein
VDHRPRVHHEPSKGLLLHLIRAIGFAICGGGRPHATSGGARPARGGALRRLRRRLAGEGVLELLCTNRDADWTGRKIKTTRSSPGGRGGGGTPERTCAKEGRTGDQVLAGEGIAASVACSWVLRWVPGVPMCAWEGERGVRESRKTQIRGGGHGSLPRRRR